MKEKTIGIFKLLLVIIATISLTLIISTSAYAASLSVDKSTMQTGDTVTANYSVTWNENEGGFIGFFKKDADDGHWITYKKLDFNMETLTLGDPKFSVKVEEAGSYEFRLFTDYWGTKKVATAPVEVIFTPSSTIEVQPATVYAGDKITAAYTISKIDGENTAGWIGFYKKGEDNNITYKKTGGVSGKFELTAPETPGDYEFRLFKDYFGAQKLVTAAVNVKAKPVVDDGEDSNARFNSVTGEVGVSPDPEKVEWKPATPKTVLKVGDHISTGRDSSCIIQFEDMTTFVMKPETEVIVNKPVKQVSKTELVLGHLWVNTKKMFTNGTMEVEMGQAVAGIKGTTFVCDQTKGKSTLKVIEGVVELKSKVNNAIVMVSSGEMVTADSKGLGAKQTFDRAKENKDWSGTGASATPNNEKVIVLQIGNKKMTVDTVQKEIDPGKGTTPVILGGRTVLPIRAIVEELGGTVEWVASEKKVTLKLKSITVEMWIDKTTILVNGVQKNMDVGPKVINGRTMIPVRFAAENLGANVAWENSTKKAYVTYFQ